MFQVDGPAMAKARRPYVSSQCRGRCSRFSSSERRCLDSGTEWTAKYWCARPLRHRRSMTTSLNMLDLGQVELLICSSWLNPRSHLPVWGDWKRETWHRKKIVGSDIARLDNAAPYRKGGHRETCFSVRVDAHYKFMFDSRSIIWAVHRFHVCSSSSFCFTYCYVRQTKLASSLDNVWAHYKIVIDCVIDW